MALVVAGLLLCGAVRANGPMVAEPDIAAAAPEPAARQELRRLYEAQARLPLWTDAGGRPNRNARAALALLADAATDGLDPAAYRAAELAASVVALQAAASSGADVGAFDAAMSAAVLRYLRHLHAGRVDARAVGFRVPARGREPDYGALLRDALAGERLAATASELMPTLPQYRRLRALLVPYRLLAAAPAEPLPAWTRPVKPGAPCAGLPALQR
ncbi:MAG TPA: hypothetical protein VF319_11740, partial [Caldimonas sp.]